MLYIGKVLNAHNAMQPTNLSREHILTGFEMSLKLVATELTSWARSAGRTTSVNLCCFKKAPPALPN